MKFVTVAALAISLSACDPGPRVSGQPVSHWVTQLDDLDLATRREALEKLALVDGTHLQPARPKLVQIWNSTSPLAPLAGKILTEKKLGLPPKGVSLEKAQKLIDESKETHK